MAFALGALGLALPFVAAPVTGSAGATVGAVIAAILALALAYVVWPQEWAPAEVEHRRLDSIWRELRSDADVEAPWERHLAWAEPGESAVVIGPLTRVPVERGLGDAPSPYRWRERLRLAADDIATAAEAMETLRAEAAELEAAAERRFRDAQSAAERRAHEERLAAIEREAGAEVQPRAAALRHEQAEQEAAERRAQAEAVAQALRRP